jgi:hypothetical protein
LVYHWADYNPRPQATSHTARSSTPVTHQPQPVPQRDTSSGSQTLSSWQAARSHRESSGIWRGYPGDPCIFGGSMHCMEFQWNEDVVSVQGSSRPELQVVARRAAGRVSAGGDRRRAVSCAQPSSRRTEEGECGGICGAVSLPAWRWLSEVGLRCATSALSSPQLIHYILAQMHAKHPYREITNYRAWRRLLAQGTPGTNSAHRRHTGARFVREAEPQQLGGVFAQGRCTAFGG